MMFTQYPTCFPDQEYEPQETASTYYDPHYFAPVVPQNLQPVQAALPQRTDMIVHAPMPTLLGQNPLWSRNFEDLSEYQTQYSASPLSVTGSDTVCYYPEADQQSLASGQWSDEVDQGSQHPIATFPTPSELLVELSTKNDLALSAPGYPSKSPSLEPPQSADDAKSEASRGKARRRVTSHSIGQATTSDPETISSHEKKRHYLECLEQYVMYLHQQLELLNVSPVPLKRVQSYGGLKSRSIRTLLVHMEKTSRGLASKTKAEEDRFAQLREEVMSRNFSNEHPAD
ncbi:hypothetical protein CC2G_001071 [Coprinopsis cinerea AmutBmut pab1-1]|nr:hypothetical protein CC2G_001071 [Coprinopsis cinerea AmutBmut pab1-1]